ncbi:MAG: cytoskeletal protein RodZ [Alphaproteobacteria bacterium]|jgi:cytoskeletal protein RodZ
MHLSTTWIIVIIVVVFAIVFSNIMMLIQSNKPFTFPDSYEKTAKQKLEDEEAQKDEDKPSS